MLTYKILHAYLLKIKVSTHRFRPKPDEFRITTQARFPSYPGTINMLRTKLKFWKIKHLKINTQISSA